MNAIDLKDRVAVVTGGARGIGQAIVNRFLKSGARCSIWDKDEAAAQEFVSQLDDPSRVEVQPVDLTSPESVAEAAQKTAKVEKARSAG